MWQLQNSPTITALFGTNSLRVRLYEMVKIEFMHNFDLNCMMMCELYVIFKSDQYKIYMPHAVEENKRKRNCRIELHLMTIECQR